MIILLLLITVLNGCTNSSLNDKKKFIGTWMRTTDEDWKLKNYTFLENGTFFLSNVSDVIGTWDAKDGIFTTVFLGVNSSSYYVFSNNDQTLTLTDVTYPDVKLVLKKISSQ